MWSERGSAWAVNISRLRPASCGLLAVTWLTIGPMIGSSLWCTAFADEAVSTRLLYNAKVFTAEPAAPYAEAVAIRGDKIVAVGDLASVRRRAGPAAKEVDLGGKFLMPGMIDSHVHPILGGLSPRASYEGKELSISKLSQFAENEMTSRRGCSGDVLVIDDINAFFWTNLPDLDAALSAAKFANQPILLTGRDGHTGWANAFARKCAGITRKYVRSLRPTTRYLYDTDSNFNPNGFVVDAAVNVLKRRLRVPQPSLRERMNAGRFAVQCLNSLGITGWLDAAASGWIGGDIPLTDTRNGLDFLPIYRKLSLSGELTAHVAAYPVIDPNGGSAQIKVVKALRAKYENRPDLVIPGFKVFADGIVDYPAQTAALTKPYRNPARRGRRHGRDQLLFKPKRFNALVKEADKAGLIVHVHAIGNLAVKKTLDGFAAARRANGTTRLPHTLTHAQFVDDEDIKRFACLGVLAALQLYWANAEGPSTNEYVQPYIDPTIYRTMYPAGALFRARAVIAGASDWPVSTANPFKAIYWAEKWSGPKGVRNAGQGVKREAMLYAYTRNSARVLNQLDRIGTIAAGKEADLVLLDKDVLTVSADEMHDTKVIWTMIGGRTIFPTPTAECDEVSENN
jgi:predicted amidohydrolase YtcJ